jgi:ATP-binding cassette subfamily F protein uup
VLSYLGDFLFPPQRANAPVKMLSGGERNRLLLARLFALPANLLVLDEPTNDLDIESLELLEDTLQSYAGTLLLVSHDRTFLDNVVTQTLVAESASGDGTWKEYVVGYSDWVAQRPRVPAQSANGTKTDALSARSEPRGASAARAKISFKERHELDSLPAELEALEREQHEISARMSATDYHKHGIDAIRRDRARAAKIEVELAEKFDRWAALDARAGTTS